MKIRLCYINTFVFRASFMLIGILVYDHAMGQQIAQHRWENRVLIIQASESSVKEYQVQLEEFHQAEKDLVDRKLVIYEVVGDQYRMINYEENIITSWQPINDLFEGIIDQTTSFSVTLIGLDGGVKLKQSSLLTKSILFDKIDSMPMRMQELRNNERF